MNHTLLLASLERLHDRITTLEKGVDGVHLGMHKGNPHRQAHNNSHGNPVRHEDSHGNPPIHQLHHFPAAHAVASAHAVVVNTVAEEIVHIAESWVGNVEPNELLRIPTESQRKALVDYIKRHNSGIPKSELSAAVITHLHTSVLTQNIYVRHLVSVVHIMVDQAYSHQHR